MRGLQVLVTLAGLVVASVGGSLVATFPAGAAQVPPGVQDVRVYDYDLGDRALTVPGFSGLDDEGESTGKPAPIELAGRVYAPSDARGRRMPFVVIAHGLFWTCANVKTGDTSGAWPCRGRSTSIKSYGGYDEIGRTLAARGMVVISVSANGVNAAEQGYDQDRARAQVVFQHLRLWHELVEHHRGPLVGALREPATGRSADPDLTRAADFRRVGLVGHSRGGRGMMWAAATAHRSQVPAGIRIGAVVGLASAQPAFLDRDVERLQVSDVPLMSWTGTCDPTGGQDYNDFARRGRNPVNIALTVHGANHNNLNTRWAAGGGPGGEDDAIHPPGRPDLCLDGSESSDSPDPRTWKALAPVPERRVAATYVEAFLARHLQGDTSFDPVLSGRKHPVADLTQVDLRRFRPAG